ncbi:MAG TPA: peptidoglycan DD-metalloendopeptidase family protein, partial [Fimbriimonadaceae bacterium]|nr:peptidoglycan DD-metalloendopeptidase family protein [Fimbriimonadaceae bacterium]
GMALAACLCVLLMLGDASAQHKRARHRKKPAKSSVSTKKLREKLHAVQSQKEKIRSKLHATQRKVNAVAGDIDRVDAKLETTQAQLEQTMQALEADRAKQAQLAIALRNSERRLAHDIVSVRHRLRGMYMEGDAPAIGVLLGSTSSGDIAGRAYLLDRVATADKRALDAYRRQRDILAEQTHEAELLVQRINATVERQKQDEVALEAARNEKADILENLQEQKGELQELLDQFERDESSIEAQIRAAQAASKGKGNLPIRFTGRLGRPVVAPITSGFGMRFHPILHKMRIHAGIDFGAPRGAAIHAAAAGVVINAQYMRGFGNVVIIDHGGGIATVYGHCSRLLVSAGQKVARGEHIADVGSTGLATGPHLHFEVHVHGKAVNPIGWL